MGHKFVDYICSVFSADYEGGSDLFCEGCLDGGRRGRSLMAILEVLFILRAVSFTWLATAALYHG